MSIQASATCASTLFRMLGVVFSSIFASPLYAYDFNDPFEVTSRVSVSQAKNMPTPGHESCESEPELPVPLKLIDAVEYAVCRNPQSRKAWAWAKSQAANLGGAQSAYLPKIGATGKFGRSETESRFSDDPTFNTDSKAREMNGSLNLSWVLYDFGLRAANLEISRHLLNAANASQDQALQSIFLNTAKAYYEAQAAQSLLAANTAAEQSAAKSFNAAQEKYALGVGTLADKLQAETSLAQARVRRIQSDGDLRNALGNLAVQMGLKPYASIELTGISADEAQNPEFNEAIEQLIENAIHDHPKILAAQGQLQAAQAKVDATMAEGMPTLTINASQDYFSTSATPINNQGSAEQTLNSERIGLQINIPLFEGFGRLYKVRELKAQAEIKAAELEELELQISIEVWKSYQALRTETENLAATKVLTASAKQSFEVAQGRYKAGLGNILELLKAQTDLASAHQQHYLAVTRWQTAKIQLAASLGELSMSSIGSDIR